MVRQALSGPLRLVVPAVLLCLQVLTMCFLMLLLGQ
jgi:hypothetical protein